MAFLSAPMLRRKSMEAYRCFMFTGIRAYGTLILDSKKSAGGQMFVIYDKLQTKFCTEAIKYASEWRNYDNINSKWTGH